MEGLEIFQQTAEAFIALLAVLGNALVLYVVYRQKSLRTTTNYLIASLSSADFLVGAVGIPCVIVNNLGLPPNFYGCLFMNCVIVCMTQVSIFSLMMIALERCAAVLAPIKHRQYFRGRVVLASLAMVWVSAMLIGCLPMFGWHPPAPPTNVNFTCSFVLVIDLHYMVFCNFFGFVLTPILIMYGTYGYIYRFITRARRIVQRNAVAPAVTAGGGGGGDKGTDPVKSSQLSKETSATKRIFLVLVFFTVCWLPLHTMNTITLLAGKTYFPAIIVAVFLTHANSAFNPLLYALTNPKILAAFKTTLGAKEVKGGKATELGDLSLAAEGPRA